MPHLETSAVAETDPSAATSRLRTSPGESKRTTCTRASLIFFTVLREFFIDENDIHCVYWRQDFDFAEFLTRLEATVIDFRLKCQRRALKLALDKLKKTFNTRAVIPTLNNVEVTPNLFDRGAVLR